MPPDAPATQLSPDQNPARAFEDDYADSVHRLRGALIEAYQAAGIDPESPREAARDLGLDKTLTWKVSRIINEDAIERVAASIPGSSAIRLLLEALTRTGASDALVQRVNAAFESFDGMVEIHTGDRESLGLLLDSMAMTGSDRLVKSRKLAFKGNSGIWGSQARVRLTTSFIAPNRANPSMLDHAQVGGYIDLQRLRTNGAWPLFRFRYFNDDGSTVRPIFGSIDGAPDERTPHLLRDFCVGGTQDILTKQVQSGLVYELSGGRVGKTGQSSLFYGYADDARLSRYRDEHNTLGEVLCLINLPIETLVMDFVVHRDVAETISPEAVVYGRASGELNEHEQRDDRLLLPMSESLTALGYRPVLATPHVPRYTEIAAKVYERFGMDESEFVAWRLVVPYPPMTSTVSIRFELPPKA